MLEPDAERAALWKRFAVFQSTVQCSPNPVDDWDGWRSRWAEVKRLALEVDGLAAQVVEPTGWPPRPQSPDGPEPGPSRP